ncbi:glycoside hydrolase family 3 C-terminal domain-containing protein [bacterium]|nr:glycoside hydrolase family 3 C-terminal domain-containing protein [bacterium]
MRKVKIPILPALLAAAVWTACSGPADVDSRAAKLLSQMTLEEKADMLSGTGFDSRPVPRLGIPSMKMADGPLGVRKGRSTAFPSGVAMAATWDPVLVGKVGSAIAVETRGKGLNVLLGPCVNIHRVPHGGRNFESFGEDPFLASRMAVSYIRGMQAKGVIATVKHFAVNNQESERFTINAAVDERTLREIYFPAFKASVQEAGVWAVMGAYNRLNGPYCCAHPWLLTDVLKNEWGFKGLVMSDWGAVHDVDSTLNGGLDLEMPGGQYLTKEAVLAAIRKGRVPEKTLDDKVFRMLRTMLAAGLFDSTRAGEAAVDTPVQAAVALQAARESAVLLKNSAGMLPLDRKRILSIAVIGPHAEKAVTGGGGSSKVDPLIAVSPLECIQRKLGATVDIRSARGVPEAMDLTPVDSINLSPSGHRSERRGLVGEYFTNPDLQGSPTVVRTDSMIAFHWGDQSPHPALPADGFSVRWTGSLVPTESGTYSIGIGSDDGSRLWLDGRLLVDNWGQHALTYKTGRVNLKAGSVHPIRIEMYEGPGGADAVLAWKNESAGKQDELSLAVEAARGADAAVVFAGSTEREESEGFDRPDLRLDPAQEELIRAVSAVNPNTAVVLYSGAMIDMNAWVDSVEALVQVWFPGQEGGTAIADILFGDANPSGKLPTTFARKWEDCPAYGRFPGEKGRVEYSEGLYVGYRYFDRYGIEPLFPFGHGLSYTTFEYGKLKVSPSRIGADGKVKVRVSVRNTGPVAGAEVVQVYVSDTESSVDRPKKELKAFRKVRLEPGQSRTVDFSLDRSALSFWDPASKDWKAEPGRFKVLVGSSSRDIRLEGGFELE